jgi:hypothetical protein
MPQKAPGKSFKPYGSPPMFDLDDSKDSFELWHAQWNIFLALTTIDTALDEDDCPGYKISMLVSCLSKDTTVLCMGLSEDDLEDHKIIIKHLRERCNAGRNRHVWRQQFAMKKQRSNETADN